MTKQIKVEGDHFCGEDPVASSTPAVGTTHNEASAFMLRLFYLPKPNSFLKKLTLIEISTHIRLAVQRRQSALFTQKERNDD